MVWMLILFAVTIQVAVLRWAWTTDKGCTCGGSKENPCDFCYEMWLIK